MTRLMLQLLVRQPSQMTSVASPQVRRSMKSIASHRITCNRNTGALYPTAKRISLSPHISTIMQTKYNRIPSGIASFSTDFKDDEKKPNDEDKRKPLATKQDVFNVPNMITFSRIGATPYLGYLIVNNQYKAAIGLLAVAGFSDWLDGYIARSYNLQSTLGSFLDPLADKFLISTLCLTLYSSSMLPGSLTALIFGRDLLLVAGTLYHRVSTKSSSSSLFDVGEMQEGFEIQPSALSKWNTALQIGVFGMCLIEGATNVIGPTPLISMFGVVGTTTFLSGCEYLYGYMTATGAFQPLRKAVRRIHQRTDKRK